MMYWRIPFEWAGELPVPPGAHPRRMTWQPAGECADLTQLVAAVLADSVDASDRQAVDQSGRGLARLLLRKATRILVDHGVWRIHCDTAAANAPMIHLFESEGWTRLAAEQRPIGIL